MLQRANFQNQEIVWAKLSTYPWWPARISNSFQQDDKIVYKISFFGDPTYCFLHQDNLLHFKDLDPASAEYMTSYSKLKQPIQLATAAYSKRLNQQKKTIDIKQTIYPTEQSHPIICQQPQTFELKKNNFQQQTPVKDYQQQYSQSQKQTFQSIIDVSISKDSIIDVLNTGIVRKLRSFKGYAHKKITHNIIHQLQTNLLSKYNLCNLEKSQKVKLIKKQKSFSKKTKKQSNGKHIGKNEISIHRLCVQKLFPNLKGKLFTTFQAQQLSVKIVNKLKQQGSSDQFKKIFVVFMKWMNRVDKIHLENFESSFFQTFGITKKEDHQNSKITEVGFQP